MMLENIVFDASDPARLGGFWQELLGGQPLSDDAGGFETRLAWSGPVVLDLCFQPVPGQASASGRLELDLQPVTGHGRDTLARALELGAVDVGHTQDGARRLQDPEGNEFRIPGPAQAPAAQDGPCPLARIRLASADPARDLDFWRWLCGWRTLPGRARQGLVHPSRRGPRLLPVPERCVKSTGKNPVHLDVRAGPGEHLDKLAAGVLAHGGRELDPGWGTLPWRIFADPSGNEFCVLPAAGAGT